MVTYAISRDFAAVAFERGIRPDPQSLVPVLLRSNGLEPWRDMEAELYEGNNGCLLIARPRTPLMKERSRSCLRLRRS